MIGESINRIFNTFRTTLPFKRDQNKPVPIQRKNTYITDYKEFGKLAEEASRFQTGGVLPRSLGNVSARRSDIRTKKRLVVQAALSGINFNFPTVFLGDKGVDFLNLIRKADDYKTNTFLPMSQQHNNYIALHYGRVTGYELFTYFRRNCNNRSNVAYKFRGYSEECFRKLAKGWFDVRVTQKSISKILSDSADLNSAQHRAYLAKLGLTEKNAETWLVQAFKDRVTLDIHSFEIFPNNALRLAYLVPIPVKQSQNSPSNIIACDSSGFFKSNLVCFKIVFEIPFDFRTRSLNKKGARLITGYLHNSPFKADDKQTLLHPSPNTPFWGGHKGTLRAYLNTIGLTGMKPLPQPVEFKILNRAKSSAAKQIEAKYARLNLTGIPCINPNPTQEYDINVLKVDYQQHVSQTFKKPCDDVNKAYKLFKNQQQI